ncbi:hypothetical protein Bbelb_366890 [Branchiostoma belcheri]|nr:hypothetical protein Bbelb_366890 [Branchiostoma belcheri]
MRFRLSYVGVTLLLVACTVTITLIGRKSIWLAISDPPSGRLETRSIHINVGCSCDDSETARKNERTSRDTKADIIRLINTVLKDSLERNSSSDKSQSPTKLDIVGHELAECCDVESSVMTKRNVRVGDVLPNVLNPKLPLKITRDIYSVLPKESPFRTKHYQRCAVVGNSGILQRSRCGASIDSADAVFSDFVETEKGRLEDIGCQKRTAICAWDRTEPTQYVLKPQGPT